MFCVRLQMTVSQAIPTKNGAGTVHRLISSRDCAGDSGEMTKSVRRASYRIR